ncbi:MAG TPA: hypothetical protein VIH61_05570 [Waddliaceae bacterium]
MSYDQFESNMNISIRLELIKLGVDVAIFSIGLRPPKPPVAAHPLSQSYYISWIEYNQFPVFATR